nr:MULTISPECIES: T9SS type A sorting domain-containing protein [unclassified Allomuricauda]
MKKNVILLSSLFLFLINSAFGQDYALWTSTKPYQANTPGYNYSAGYVKLADNWLLDDPNPGIYTNIPQPPIKAGAYERQTFNLLGNPNTLLCSGGGSEWINKYEPFVFGHNGVIQICHDIISDEPEDYTSVWQYAVILPYYVQPNDNERTHDDLLFITNQNNFQDQISNVSGVKWRYSFDNNVNFIDFPENIKHQFPLNATVGEILANEVNANSIQNLRVKMALDVPNSIIPQIESGILTFTIIQSSPNLIPPIIPIAEECPNTNNGSFTMTVDRDLDEDEFLFVALYAENNDDQVIDNEYTETLFDNEDGTYSYTWPENLALGNYKIKYQTRTEGEDEPDDQSWNSLEHSLVFTIDPADPVTYTLTPIDVNCFGGSDGQIQINANGGTDGNYQFRLDGGNWTNFSGQHNHTITGLPVDDYSVDVRDGNNCAGTINDNEVTIDEPEEEIQFSGITIQDATAFGFTNGSINVHVSGGTEGYTYEWTDGNNNTVDTGAAQHINGVYKITLEDISADTYTLTVWDSKYNLANQNNNGGCTYFDSFAVDEPPLLQLEVEETIPISCNSANNYNNPSNDGQLTAVASGGVPPYQYSWKKKINGFWQDIPNQDTAILNNLEAGEYAVNIEDVNGIVIGTYVNNQLQQTNDVTYALEEPELLTVQIEKTDINCFGGSDGTATAIINGGTPPYEFLWSSGANTEAAEGLWLGNHTVYVVDALGCEAEAEVTIEQPDAPVSISNPEYVQPTANGFTDGSITVQVNGGTPFDDDSYSYEWRDEENNLINTTSAQVNLEGCVIQLHDIPAGTYTITVTDANYENAVQQEGCTYVEVFILTEPPALELSVEQTIPISCNGGNQFNNPSDDGQLKAIASGGVPFEPLIDGQYGYIYTWKKKDEQNNWQIIPNVTGNILDNVDVGEYAVNIEDANGIVLGVYLNNVLQEPTDYIYPVAETEPIVLQLDKIDVSCFNGHDGFASVAIEGGMPPYDVSWSSGAVGEMAENLMAGTYFVYVKDFYGCEASGQITIEQPEELKINIMDTVVPSCYDANNGSITVSVSGGIGEYTFLWNTGETTLTLSALYEGTYTLEVMDGIGCTTTKEILLEAPFPTEVILGADRTLCNGQQHFMDIGINDPQASYLWTSNTGFTSTSPQVNLSEAGIYTATVTNSLGCSGSDTIEITTTEIDIDAQFLISSQAFAGEEVVLVNTSSPIGTNEEWVFPQKAKVVEQTEGMAIVRFDEPGAYEVILRNYHGDCYQDVTKTIIVAEAMELPDVGDAIAPFIKEFKIFPNPSSGSFTVMVSLQEEATASLRIFGLTTNHVYDEQQLTGSAIYEVPYTMDLASGVYLVLLETSKGSEIRKIVIL